MGPYTAFTSSRGRAPGSIRCLFPLSKHEGPHGHLGMEWNGRGGGGGASSLQLLEPKELTPGLFHTYT